MEQNNLNDEGRIQEASGRAPQMQEVVYQSEEDEKSITLGQIWHMIKKHWISVAICGLVGFGGAFAYAKLIKSPKYQATAQILVREPTTSNSISLSTRISTASAFLQSDSVASAVGAKMASGDYVSVVQLKDDNGNVIDNEYDISAIKQLYSVSASSTTNSPIITITSSCKTAQMAKDVANYVSEVGIQLANTESNPIYTYLGGCLSPMNEASQAKDASTSNVLISLIGVLAGLVVGCIYAIIRELTDTKVTSKGELETLTGYKVIGMIPKYEIDKDEENEEGEKENGTK